MMKSNIFEILKVLTYKAYRFWENMENINEIVYGLERHTWKTKD